MAMKFNREAIFKYADKAFLGVALAFLVFTVAMLFVGKSDVKISYQQVANTLKKAESDQRDAHIREYFKDRKELLSLSPEEREIVELVQKTPFFAKMARLEAARRPELKGKRFLPPEDYAANFINQHNVLAAAWATTDHPAPYKAIRIGGARERQKRYIPPSHNDEGQPRRIAPTKLLLVQGRGYSGTGKEPQEFGSDRFYVSGQAVADLGQQLEWCREYSPDDKTLNRVYLTDYEVQRRQRLPDGTWTQWKDRRTVRHKNVSGKPAVRRIRAGDPAVLDRDPKKRQRFLDYGRKRLLPEFQRKGTEILRPAFYEMTGQDWLQPYEILGIGVESAEEAEAAETETDASGYIEVPLDEPEEQTGSQVRGTDETELWFNDLIPITDLGKTYQYRVRIKFFNPIFGAPPEEAKADQRFVVEVPGNWSQPSAPITVEPVVKFYFAGRAQAFNGETKANIDLFRWKHGKWYIAKAVQFEIGDPIAYVKRLPLEIPTKRGMVKKMEVKTSLSFRANAVVVDVLEATMMVSGRRQKANKLIYRSGTEDNRLASRLDRKDRDKRGRFLKEIQEREEKLKNVRRRTIRERTPIHEPGPEDRPPEDMGDQPPQDWGQEGPPPERMPRRRRR